ncbi:MAG: nucleotidyltransferase family protein [Gammaproteobacteria bacterium]|nr:MAG: nucleotidyltransferase family protein [Gammaproteobacteria bacterium]UTW41728.1 nucleotidyltransferase family protein [bacterium SCSIO 12844]
MKAMILAAGRGRRMRHLTEDMPKPLLSVRGKSLLEAQIDRLVKSGVSEIIINVAYLGNQIIKAIGFGDRWGVKIVYSCEVEPLETGGGICRALAFLSETFIVVNADIVTDYDYSQLLQFTLNNTRQAHLILVENPPHHLKGDFSVDNNIPTTKLNSKTYTFSGIGLYHQSLFEGYYSGCNVRLPDIWKKPMTNQKVTAEIYHGVWADIGTPERLSVYN